MSINNINITTHRDSYTVNQRNELIIYLENKKNPYLRELKHFFSRGVGMVHNH